MKQKHRFTPFAYLLLFICSFSLCTNPTLSDDQIEKEDEATLKEIGTATRQGNHAEAVRLSGKLHEKTSRAAAGIIMILYGNHEDSKTTNRLPPPPSSSQPAPVISYERTACRNTTCLAIICAAFVGTAYLFNKFLHLFDTSKPSTNHITPALLEDGINAVQKID